MLLESVLHRNRTLAHKLVDSRLAWFHRP